jgi:TonB family protein
MRTLVLIVLLSLAYASPTLGQCLHGPNEEAAQKARRWAALAVVRDINTTEAKLRVTGEKKYLPFADLNVSMPTPTGFEPQFTTNGESYALILRDKTDPCGFSFATNELAIIFQGYPIACEVEPHACDRTQTVYTLGSGVTAPLAVKQVRPVYTEAAKAARLEGVVTVDCVVQPDGTVSDVSVSRSLDPEHGLDDAAIQAARQYRFEPGTKDGHPVPVRISIDFTFTLR